MKDVTKTEIGLKSFLNTEIILSVFKYFSVALLSFISARAQVKGDILPFGLSFVGGMPINLTPYAAIGAFLGYFFPAISEGGFKYIAALLSIVAIKLLLSYYKRLVENPFFLSFCVLLSALITSAVSISANPDTALSNMLYIALSFLGAYFVSRTSLALKNTRAGLEAGELACLLFVASIIIMGAQNINILGVSLGKILGVTLILTAAKYGGILSGVLSGIAIAFTCLLSGELSLAYVVFSFGGLLSGLFSPFGRYAQIAAFLSSGLLSAAILGFGRSAAVLLAQILIGSVVFILLPRNAGIVLSKLFCSLPRFKDSENLKSALNLRLSKAASALNEVSETVDKVAGELSKLNAPDFGRVISLVERDVCKGCKLRLHCFEAKRDKTVEGIVNITKAVRQGENDVSLFAGEELSGRCVRLKSLSLAVKQRYLEYTSLVSAEERLGEVRCVVADQFSGVSYMLKSLAKELGKDEQFDNSLALNAVSSLRNLNILTKRASARVDKFGRVTLEMQIIKKPDTVINRMQIMRLLSLACERNFSAPVLSQIRGKTFLTLTEQANFRVDIGVNQICAGNNTMCGDAYSYFSDGKGHLIMILSDGMGTGGRAAVDGAMATGLMTKLLKAGFGFESALKILNSSMLFKSTDESLATLDIAMIDLFTGEAELYKAGAAPSLVRCSGKVGKAESNSVPIGILRDVRFDRAKIKLKQKDVLLLLSDGVFEDGSDWIKDELARFDEGSAQSLAEHISECALRRRENSHADDITVIAAVIEKSVPEV